MSTLRFLLLVLPFLVALSAGCGYNVTVGRLEEEGPTTTVHPDGSITTSTNKRTWKTLEVRKAGE